MSSLQHNDETVNSSFTNVDERNFLKEFEAEDEMYTNSVSEEFDLTGSGSSSSFFQRPSLDDNFSKLTSSERLESACSVLSAKNSSVDQARNIRAAVIKRLILSNSSKALRLPDVPNELFSVSRSGSRGSSRCPSSLVRSESNSSQVSDLDSKTAVQTKKTTKAAKAKSCNFEIKEAVKGKKKKSVDTVSAVANDDSDHKIISKGKKKKSVDTVSAVASDDTVRKSISKGKKKKSVATVSAAANDDTERKSISKGKKKKSVDKVSAVANDDTERKSISKGKKKKSVGTASAVTNDDAEDESVSNVKKQKTVNSKAEKLSLPKTKKPQVAETRLTSNSSIEPATILSKGGKKPVHSTAGSRSPLSKTLRIQDSKISETDSSNEAPASTLRRANLGPIRKKSAVTILEQKLKKSESHGKNTSSSMIAKMNSQRYAAVAAGARNSIMKKQSTKFGGFLTLAKRKTKKIEASNSNNDSADYTSEIVKKLLNEQHVLETIEEKESAIATIEEVNAPKVAESNIEEQNLEEIKEDEEEATSSEKEEEDKNDKTVQETIKSAEEMENLTERPPVVVIQSSSKTKTEEIQQQPEPIIIKCRSSAAIAPGFTPMKQIGEDEFQFNLYSNHDIYSIGTLMSHVSNSARPVKVAYYHDYNRNCNSSNISSQCEFSPHSQEQPPLTYVAANPLTVYAHPDQSRCSTNSFNYTTSFSTNQKPSYTSRLSCTSNSRRISVKNGEKTDRVLLARH